jgi:hypothetical protein
MDVLVEPAADDETNEPDGVGLAAILARRSANWKGNEENRRWLTKPVNGKGV